MSCAESGKKKSKSPQSKRLSDVDPARLALASSGANAEMLLYALRARIHRLIVKQKKALLQGTLSL